MPHACLGHRDLVSPGSPGYEILVRCWLPEAESIGPGEVEYEESELMARRFVFGVGWTVFCLDGVGNNAITYVLKMEQLKWAHFIVCESHPSKDTWEHGEKAFRKFL